MTDTLTFNLRFLSDWHIGDGAGARGHVDAVVRRHPEDDLPYCPAKTLTGILRDGCERIAYGLDRGNAAGPWHGLLREIFGSNQQDDEAYRAARPAKLSVGAARFAPEVRDAIASRADMREALVLLKPGVKLDAFGVAESQMLRFEEAVLAGAELRADSALALSGPRRRSALALLAAGTQAVDRLGAKRRRGAGRCELTLEGGLSSDKLEAALKEAPPPSEDKQASAPALHLGGQAAGGAGAHWRVVRLVLDLSSPVVVPADTLGNMVTTHDHIPGSLLVPALNQWLRKLLGDKTTGALASGAVQVRNAYLAAGGRRLLPAPAALFKLKEGIETSNHLHDPPDDKRQRKQVRVGFVATDGLPKGDKAALTPMTVATTHATIDDDVQRPTSGVGGVYSYKALRPGQRLLSELWIDTALIPTDVDFDNWLTEAPQSLRIGRAKKDDYGRVALTCRQITALGKPAAAAKGLTLWLASPLLLRDDALSPVLNAHGVAEALTAALGVAVKVRNDGEGIFLLPWRDDGWNNAWQMRRPTRFGLAPGSCFAFEAEAMPSADALARMQAQGLGERRGEGYGEVVFNAPLLAGPPHRAPERIDLPLDMSPRQRVGTLQPTEFSQALQRRAGRLAIRRKALEQDAHFRKTLGWRSGDAPLPPNTQLGALRALMESLHDVGGLTRVRSWLDATQDNDKRRDKWPTATVRTLSRHLADDSPDSIWASLEMPGGPEPLPNHNREALAAELRIEAIKTLWLTAISRQLNSNNRAQTVGSAREEASHGA